MVYAYLKHYLLSFLIAGCAAQGFFSSQSCDNADNSTADYQADSNQCDLADKPMTKTGCDASCDDGEWKINCPIPSTTGGTGCSLADEPIISKAGCSN